MKITTLRVWTLSALLAITAGTGVAIAFQPATDAPPTPVAAAPAAAPSTGYTRVVEKEDGTLSLEIAAKTFAPADGKAGPKVHLVGAVHIADKPFYEQLQKMLDATDLVLFEGVKPPGAGAFDADLDNAGKVKATQARLHFLLSVLEENRARTGKLPASLQEAVDEAGKRWKMMIASSLTDAWGHPIQYTVTTTEGGSELNATQQRAVVTSLGADGVLQDGKGGGDDVQLEGKPAPKKSASKDAGLQAKMADALGLKFQLDIMDSSKPNWRSSDMSVDQLQAKFEAAGVGGDQLFKMLDGSSFMGQLASMVLGLVKSSPQLAATVKLTMVDLLSSDDAISGGGGVASMKKMMSVIVKDRNDVVLKDLKSVIDTEDKKDVAIFYGAGHFGDMEAKLKKDFGYTLVNEEWLEAITVSPKDAGMTPAQAKKMRDVMKQAVERQTEAAEKADKAAKAKKRDENIR